MCGRTFVLVRADGEREMRNRSVLVVVLAVPGVPTSVVDVVDVVVVRHRDVATAVAVDMIVALVHRVTGGLAFVVVTVMPPMEMAVVQVVDMVAMWDCHMPATVSMCMVMLEVLSVSSHGVSSLLKPNRTIAASWFRRLDRRPGVRFQQGPLALEPGRTRPGSGR